MSLLGLDEPAGPEPPPRRITDSTLNPFRLWRLSLQWRGSFSGGQVFVVMLAGFVLNIGLVVALVESESAAPALKPAIPVILAAWMLFLAVTFAGSLARRLNDLGLPVWLLPLVLVPVLNVVFVLYLLFAPGREDESVRRAPLSFSALAKMIAVVLFCGGPIALSLPGMMSARRSSNESATIGDLRTLMSAQAAYQVRNGGAYESRWECLVRPSDCIPGDNGPPDLPADFLRTPKMGYAWEFRNGPPAPRPPALSATSVTGYAIVARPLTDDARTFCADMSGRICFSADAAATLVVTTPEPEGVRCTDTCTDLR